MSIYDKIMQLCKEKSVTVTGTEKELGFSRGSLCKIDKNKPSSEKLQKLADYFGVQLEYLTGASEFKTKKEMLEYFDKKSNLDVIKNDMIDVREGTTRIKVIGKVAAGVPKHIPDEDVIGYEDVSNDMIKDDLVFGLEINGDSMSPRILKGDTVIVRAQNDAENGDVVIVTINGDEATCKRLMKYADGISLISFNPAYEPMTFSNKEIEEKPIRIIGKVIENRSRF